MTRKGPTLAEVLAANPKLAGINTAAVRAARQGPRPADALAACAATGDRDVVATVQSRRRAASARGRRAQHQGAAAEGSIEQELTDAVEDGRIAWWKHFHPPSLHAEGSWRPRALRPGEGAVDYILQPFDGPSVLLESKSSDGSRFAFNELPEHQVAHLEDQVRAGLPAVLVVTFRAEGVRAVCAWASAPWRTERTARVLYADDPAVIACAVAPGGLVERLLRLAGVTPP